VDGVAVDELNGADSLAVDALQSRAHHVQHVAVCHEGAREVKADGVRLRRRRFMELDDRSVDAAFPDAEDLHSVHDRGYDVTATVAVNINIDVFHGCELARSRARFTNSFDRELLIASGMPEYANLPSSTLVVCCLAL